MLMIINKYLIDTDNKGLRFFRTKVVPCYHRFLDTKETQEDRAFTESRTLLLRSVF